MRSAKESEYFPYEMKQVCYILVSDEGVSQVIHYRKSDFNQVIEAYQLVKAGKAQLYAVWPGNYRSDLFVIDDIEQFADAFGIPR